VFIETSSIASSESNRRDNLRVKVPWGPWSQEPLVNGNCKVVRQCGEKAGDKTLVLRHTKCVRGAQPWIRGRWYSKSKAIRKGSAYTQQDGAKVVCLTSGDLCSCLWLAEPKGTAIGAQKSAEPVVLARGRGEQNEMDGA
jgi:hypothetical protein